MVAWPLDCPIPSCIGLDRRFGTEPGSRRREGVGGLHSGVRCLRCPSPSCTALGQRFATERAARKREGAGA
eukprot:5331924-Alexandrium_andersonii.AAC.1